MLTSSEGNDVFSLYYTIGSRILNWERVIVNTRSTCQDTIDCGVTLIQSSFLVVVSLLTFVMEKFIFLILSQI